MTRALQIGTAALVALVLGFAGGLYAAGPVRDLVALPGLGDEEPTTEVLGAQETRGPEEVLAPGSTRTYRYGPDEQHLLDLTRSGSTPLDEAQPVLVYLHSGGWTSGSRAFVPEYVTAQGFAGWTVVSADYRLAPEHPFPDPNEDVDRLLRWLQVHADPLGIDPDRVVLSGGSSGGHLALVAAASPGRFVAGDLPADHLEVEPAVAAVVAAVPPTNLAALAQYPADGLIGGSTLAYLDCRSADRCDAARVQAATPQVDPASAPPPALLLYGELDEVAIGRRDGEPVRVAWEAAGGELTISISPGLGHNLDVDEGFDPMLLFSFLEDVAG
jgi:acetyl esterase/lipase